jgi:hypothetical protein
VHRFGLFPVPPLNRTATKPRVAVHRFGLFPVPPLNRTATNLILL